MLEILVIIFFLSLSLGQLGAIIPIANVTLYSHELVLGLMLLVGLRRLQNRPKLRLQWPIVVFVAAGLWSLVVNASRFTQLELFVASLYLVRWVFYALLYWLVVRARLASGFWLWGLYGFGVLLAALGLVQYFLYPALRNLYYLGWDEHYYRVFSTLLDPNFVGILLVLTLFLGIYLWRTKARVLLVSGQVISLVALLLTYSRSSYLALVAGLVVLFLVNKWWWRGLLVIMLFLFLLTVLPQPGGEGVWLWRSVSILARLANWQHGMALIREAPVFGHGFNTLRYIQSKVDSLLQFPSRAGAGLDSSLQFVWATTGIVGLVAYLWLIREMVRLAFEAIAKNKKSNLGLVTLASLTSLLVHSLFTNSLFYPWVMVWAWILLGATEKLVTSGKSPGGR